ARVSRRLRYLLPARCEDRVGERSRREPTCVLRSIARAIGRERHARVFPEERISVTPVRPADSEPHNAANPRAGSQPAYSLCPTGQFWAPMADFAGHGARRL